MSNQFNYRCPKCGSQDQIVIAALVMVRLIGDVVSGGPAHWIPTTPANCEACGYCGTVKDFEAAIS